MQLYTIGFTQKSAQEFLTRLIDSGVKRLIDIRLNNVSQLAGFTKKQDLAYFLQAICGIEYLHKLELAPTKELFDAYKKSGGKWSTYENSSRELMRERKIEDKIPKELLDGACLLCSEATPERCHRRLVAEYLQEHWDDLEIIHL